MSDFFDSDYVKKFIAQMKEKSHREFMHRRYAGACYDILINHHTYAAVATVQDDKMGIKEVLLAFTQNGYYREAKLSKEQLVDVIVNNEDVPFCAPNMLGKPTVISVVSGTYAKTNPNNTQLDNLGQLPSIDVWENSDAKKYLLENLNALGIK